MELTKEIKYNKELIQNESVRIDYSGNLFKNGSNEVYIVFGYDKDWKNTTHQKMDKSENGFSTTIQLLEYSNFNFCFKDSNDNWDNNNYSDYTLKIEEKRNSTSDLNALLDDILNETQGKQEELSLTDSISKIQKIADSLLDNIPVKFQKQSDAFVSSELNDSISKIQKIANTFDELFKDTEVSKTNNYTSEEINQVAMHFDSLLDKVNLENTVSNMASAETLDLEQTFPEEFDVKVDTKTIQTPTTSENSNLALITTSKHKNIFDFDNLSPWYVLKKRIRLAFYKLIYVLPAFLFGEEDDSEN